MERLINFYCPLSKKEVDELKYRPKIGYLCTLFIIALSLIVGIVYAAISGTIASPTAGYYNNYAILLNVTTNDNANVTFNTSAFATLTTLLTNGVQGNLTLNTTFLNEGNNTIYIFVTMQLMVLTPILQV